MENENDDKKTSKWANVNQINHGHTPFRWH